MYSNISFPFSRSFLKDTFSSKMMFSYPCLYWGLTVYCKCRVGEQITERDMKALIYRLWKGSLTSIYLHSSQGKERAAVRFTASVQKQDQR